MAIDHFGWLAPYYDRIFNHQNPEQLQTLLALPTHGCLLDAGGGTGRIAQTLRGLSGPIVVTDISGGMLQQAAQKDELIPLQTHVELLPFANDSIERILVVDAFHHFCNQHQAAVELWRVLAPGGRLVIEEPNIDTWPVKLLALAERLALMGSRFYSPHQMKTMFEVLGANVQTHTDHEFNAWVVVQKRRG